MSRSVTREMADAFRESKRWEIGADRALVEAMNGLAFHHRRLLAQRLPKQFALKNARTRGSLRVDKAAKNTSNVAEATSGTIAPYLEIQEGGGSAGGRRGSKVVPSKEASGEGSGMGHRTKQIRPGSMLRALGWSAETKPKHVSTRDPVKQRMTIAAKIAYETGRDRVALAIKSGGKAGIYKISQIKMDKAGTLQKRTSFGKKRRNRVAFSGPLRMASIFRVQLMYDIRKSAVPVHPTHFNRQATAETLKAAGPRFMRNLQEELDKA